MSEAPSSEWMDLAPWPGPDAHPFDDLVTFVVVYEIMGTRQVHREIVKRGGTFRWRSLYDNTKLLGLFIDEGGGRMTRLHPEDPNSYLLMRRGEYIAWNA